MEFIDSLFEDIGVKIKNFTKFLFILAVPGSFILAWSFSTERFGEFNFLSFVLFLFAFLLFTYLSAALLYGFGELIDTLAYINGRVHTIEDKLNENKTEQRS